MKTKNETEEFKEMRTVIDDMHDGWYGRYRGNSLGRVLHYLYVICGLGIAESARVGEGKVHVNGREFATIDWSQGFPDLTFTDASYQRSKEEKMAREESAALCRDAATEVVA